MSDTSQPGSRRLLKRLRESLAEAAEGQERLDEITSLIACEMGADVCSIYLFRDADTLELCATEGLEKEAVHQTRMRLGEGLVGRVALRASPINTADAPAERGFRYMPETGEERYSAFLGVPIQRLGERLGVLVVQSRDARAYSDDDVYGLEVVAMVLAEMAELGVFQSTADPMAGRHKHPVVFRGGTGQEGAAEGRVYLHEPRVVVTNPIADDAEAETLRLREAVDKLRISVDEMLSSAPIGEGDQRQVLEAYRMFANSKGWLKRMEEDIGRGLSAEAAVEKEQSAARARMEQVPDAYLRERLHDLDDLSNRLLRLLTGQGQDDGSEMPDNPVLVARNIGPGELLAYGRMLKGIVLEEGSVGSHAAIVARALAIPLVIHASRITTEALNGDPILVDGDPRHRAPASRGDGAERLPRQDRHARQGRRALCLDPRGTRARQVRRRGGPAHERGADGRPALAGGLRRRGRRPLPHRVAVPDLKQGAPPRASWPRSTPACSMRPRAGGWPSARSISAPTRCCPT